MAKKTKRKLAHPTLPMQRQLNLQQEARHFDLQEIFQKLNRRYFRGRLRDYEVKWGRRRKLRPKEYFIFGTIQEEDRVIRINPALDQDFVPLWFLQYILFHEMLHSGVPDEETPGEPPAGAYGRIQSARKAVPQLSAGAALGRGKPGEILALTNFPNISARTAGEGMPDRSLVRRLARPGFPMSRAELAARARVSGDGRATDSVLL